MAISPRPKLSVRGNRIQSFAEVVALVGLAAMAVILLRCQPVEGPVPTHFGLDGQPDAWGEPGSLFVVPAIALVLWIGLTLLDRIPHAFNYAVEITGENAETQYVLAKALLAVLKAQSVWVFLLILWGQCQTASGGSPFPSLGWMMLLAFSFPIVLGVYLRYSFRHR